MFSKHLFFILVVFYRQHPPSLPALFLQPTFLLAMELGLGRLLREALPLGLAGQSWLHLHKEVEESMLFILSAPGLLGSAANLRALLFPKGSRGLSPGETLPADGFSHWHFLLSCPALYGYVIPSCYRGAASSLLSSRSLDQSRQKAELLGCLRSRPSCTRDTVP